MTLQVVAEVPLMYQWEGIEYGLKVSLEEKSIVLSKELAVHYAWLLRVSSWNYGVDWNPVANTLSLVLPFEGALQNINTLQDEKDYDANIATDKISSILKTVLEKVPLQRLISHFVRV